MKLKVKGPCRIVISCHVDAKGQTFSIRIKGRKKAASASTGSIPIGLQQQINFCSTAQELMALLVDTPAKDEAIIAAFDKRIEELEQQQTINIHSLKQNNHGSATHTTTA